MKKVAIQDANIIIDLANGNLLNKAIKLLDYEFVIPDLVVSEVTSPEIAKEDLNVLIEEGFIKVEVYSSLELSKIMSIDSKYSQLSVQDSACIYSSKKSNGILLTGMGHLEGLRLKKVLL